MRNQAQKRLFGAAASCAVLALAAPASAATWAQGTTPRLTQIFALDATGEPNWLWGFEDVAGDGPNFATPEEQRDLRSAYAATDANRFWARVYVSDTTAGFDTAVTAFVFLDTDQNVATGGPTVSAALSAAFTTEKSPGGYEYVLGLQGNGTLANVWSWSGTQYVVVATNPGNTAAETGMDTDPLRIGTAPHSYVQGNIDLALVGLTPACNANVYVRSAASSGQSDLDMSLTTSCVPADTNNDNIPDILVGVTVNCVNDTDCPQNGVCSAGVCIVAAPCATAADCGPNQQCTVDGRCVPIPTGTCTTNTQCTGGLVCVGGQCGACTQGGTECGTGATCAPNGTCVGGSNVPPGAAHVEGGAFNCAMGNGRGESGAVIALLGVAVAAAAGRRRRRDAHTRTRESKRG